MIDIPFISLEGSDLVGKSTLYKELWRKIQAENNFDVLLTDRGYFSILCYGVLYDRAPSEVLEEKFLRWLNKNLVIYITIDQEEVLKRYSVRSDEDRTLEEILRVKNIYDSYSRVYKDHPNFIIYNPLEDPDQLIKRIKDFQTRGIFFWGNQADQLVEKYGKKFLDTKEIVNFSFDIKEEWDYLRTYDITRENLGIIRQEWGRLEHDSYIYQSSKFMKSVETVLCGYRGKKEGLESRKFVFTDDECMSYFHILVRDSDLFVKVQFRSSDVKMLSHDLKEIIRMTLLFSKKTGFEPTNVNFSISIDSLHKYGNKNGKR